MSQSAKLRPPSKAKLFSYYKKFYVLPEMNAIQLTTVQPTDLMSELKACNSSLPPKASFMLLNAVFHTLLRRLRRSFTDVESREAKDHWKEKLRAYKVCFKNGEKCAPKKQQSTQTIDKNRKSIAIDHQTFWIPTQYDKNFPNLGLRRFGNNFISINRSHPRQDFTSRVLKQAFNTYVAHCPNMSSEIMQKIIWRTQSKAAQRFLNECARLAAEAQARTQLKAATYPADISPSSSETDTDKAEARDATDNSTEPAEKDMQGTVPAADNSSDSSPASTSTEIEAEGGNTVQGKVDDNGDSPSATNSSESEVETREVIDASHEQGVEDSSSDSSSDKMHIDDYRDDDNARGRKRRRESTSPPFTHDVIHPQDNHPPPTKRLRVARTSSPPGSNPGSTAEYGPGRDIFSALMDYLDQFVNQQVDTASMV